MKRLLSTLLAFLIPQGLAANPFFHSTDKVKTISTEHFNIHYAEPFETVAKKMAIIGERVHKKLKPVFERELESKTEVVIIANYLGGDGGSAQYTPRNTIHFPATLTHDEGKERFFIHEYTHILQGNQVHGFNYYGRKIFGQLPHFNRNHSQPAFLVEGLANYLAGHGDYVSSNRPSYSDLQYIAMRVEFNNKFKTVDQVALGYYALSTPGFLTPYLYGEFFYEFLEKKYGKDKIVQLITEYGDDILPFFVNWNAIKVFGKNYEDLWKEFRSYMDESQGEIIRTIQQNGSDGERLAGVGSTGYISAFTMVGDDIFFQNWRDNDRAGLYRYNLNTKMSYEITSPRDMWFVSYHSIKGTLWAKNSFEERYSGKIDLFVQKPESTELEQLTFGKNCTSGRWSPNGMRLTAKCFDAGNASIVEINQETKTVTTLFRSEHNDLDIQLCTWSPTGSRLLLSVQRDNRADLVELDVTNNQTIYLTNSDSDDHCGNYIDNDSIIYSSVNSESISQIRILRTDTMDDAVAMTTLSHARSPVFDPNSNNLYYVRLTADGNGIYNYKLPDIDKLAFHKIRHAKNNHQIDLSELITTKFDVSPYHSSRTALPNYWFPQYQNVNGKQTWGLKTFNQDPIIRHAYNARLVMEANENLPEWQLMYRYQRLHPTLEMSLNRYISKSFNQINDINYVKNLDEFGVAINNTERFHAINLVFGASLSYRTESFAKKPAGSLDQLNNDNQTIAGFLQYSDKERYHYSISHQRGLDIKFSAEQQLEEFSEFTSKAATIELKYYFNLPARNVLALSANTGIASSNNKYSMGGGFGYDIYYFFKDNYCCYFGSNPFPVGYGVPTFYPLRGYNAGAPQLQGNKIYNASLEWRFPLIRVERSIFTPPFGIRQIHGKVFVDHGAANNSYKVLSELNGKTGVGAELHFDVLGFFFFADTFKLGYARGMDSNIGDSQVYLNVGAAL